MLQLQLVTPWSRILQCLMRDGKYVETNSPTVKEVLEGIERINIKKNIHLMHKNPREVLDLLCSGEEMVNTESASCYLVNLVYVHVNTIDKNIFEQFPQLKFGIVLNPQDKVEDYLELINQTTVVMFMTVEPGHQGEKFHEDVLEKINQLRTNGYSGEIHIDGHVNEETIPTILSYKPNVLNVGSAIQKSENPEQSYLSLKKLIATR